MSFHTSEGYRCPTIFPRLDEPLAGRAPRARWLIAYVSDATGPPEVYLQTFPVSGGSTRVSLSGGTLPKWSSDGTRIYFFSPDGWIMESAASRAPGRIVPATPVRVVPASGSDFLPASDGQRFLIMEAAPTRPIAVANWKGLLKPR